MLFYQCFFINHSNDQVAFLLWLSEVVLILTNHIHSWRTLRLGNPYFYSKWLASLSLYLEVNVNVTSSLTTTHSKHNPETAGRRAARVLYSWHIEQERTGMLRAHEDYTSQQWHCMTSEARLKKWNTASLRHFLETLSWDTCPWNPGSKWGNPHVPANSP